MSDELPLVQTANSYSPTSLTESYQPQGSSEAPLAVPPLVSGVGPSAPTSSSTPVDMVAFVPPGDGE